MSSQKKIQHVLVVGSWAKEQITIENIKKKPDIKVFAYMSIKNPAIISLVNGYEIGALNNKNHIVKYAKKQAIDLVFITTAQPLAVGVVDALEKQGILVFGPNQKAARLESDKAYTRQLMKKHEITAIPQFKVCDNYTQAITFAQTLNWNVVVKPIGLTEGIGVKIVGDQLQTPKETSSYIHEIFNKKIGGEAKVLIEEKLEGDEFTIQCFVYGKQILTTPAVRDFKRLLPGDKGPNTASMGSFSDTGFLLPFMNEEDYLQAVNIIMNTLDAFTKDTGEHCKGFLYGQFMKTTDGLKLIEYNFRPGDPEWLNILLILDDNLIDVIQYLMDDRQEPIHFEEKATVCKYIVPRGYPKVMNQILDVTFEPEKITELGVNIYYSSGLDTQGNLRVGSERGIAFVAKEDTIMKAHELVEQAISMIDGTFHHREDIGSAEMIPST